VEFPYALNFALSLRECILADSLKQRVLFQCIPYHIRCAKCIRLNFDNVTLSCNERMLGDLKAQIKFVETIMYGMSLELCILNLWI
jgi:hypothetical protein